MKTVKKSNPYGMAPMGEHIPEGRNLSASDVWLSVKETASLVGISDRAVRKNCTSKKYRTQTVQANGGDQYLILLSSLPKEAQNCWIIEQARQDAERQGNPRERAERINAGLKAQARQDAAAGKPVEKIDLEPVPLNHEESEALWDRWERAGTGAKAEAERRHKIMLAFETARLNGVPLGEIAKAINAEHGDSESTLERWRKLIKGQDRANWLPLLMPHRPGRTVTAAFSEAAWESIKEDWGRLSQPSVASCYRRAQKLAPANGWTMPSLDTVERRIKAISPWWVVARRQGMKELMRLYPHQSRDYTTLKLHELWCADGHKADVFCRWPDGSVSRPIILGWADVRSRFCVGYEIGKTESADLVRLAFKRAAETCRAIPEAALLDNGRGFASKLLTGGQPNRYRFKVKEEEVPGILTHMGIDVVWSTPGWGQSKPIESWWRTLSQADRRAEFQGAYCGNNPDAKPEDFDPGKAVPIETYRAIIAEEIADYHQRAHRGQGMNNKTPMAVYRELINSTPVRQPTPAQLRLCLLAAEVVKPKKKDTGIVILGNRYWSEPCANLEDGKTYVARFNPEDAADPIALYDGDKFICEAQRQTLTGFRNQEAAREHNRARNRHTKSLKEQAKALKDMDKAQARALPTVKEVDNQTGEALEVDTGTGEILNREQPPAPKAGMLLHLNIQTPPKPTEEEEKAAKLRREKLAHENLKKLMAQS